MKRDFETLRRSVLRRVSKGKTMSSLPFISGDTYKTLCDVELTGNIKKCFEGSSGSSKSSFFMSGDNMSELLSYLLNCTKPANKYPRIFIHNSDFKPNPQELLVLIEYFEEVFCVNWIGSIQRVEAIPIGLENMKLMRNGVTNDYQKLINSGLPQFKSRKIEILSCFSDATNPKVRSEARDFFLKQANTLTPTEFLTPRKYRQLLINSKYVVSPPGNGDDCHRTWEAIYLGAVPIVLRKHWPFEGFHLPVMVVDSWGEVQNRLDESFEPVDVEYLRKLFIESLVKNSI